MATTTQETAMLAAPNQPGGPDMTKTRGRTLSPPPAGVGWPETDRISGAPTTCPPRKAPDPQLDELLAIRGVFAAARLHEGTLVASRCTRLCFDVQTAALRCANLRVAQYALHEVLRAEAHDVEISFHDHSIILHPTSREEVLVVAYDAPEQRATVKRALRSVRDE